MNEPYRKQSDTLDSTEALDSAVWTAVNCGIPGCRECEVEDFRLAPVDMVNHPPHYTNHPSGVECIQITEHMNFCLGNALKYIWRADLKGGVEDLKKAIFYINREIERRTTAA